MSSSSSSNVPTVACMYADSEQSPPAHPYEIGTIQAPIFQAVIVAELDEIGNRGIIQTRLK